MLTKKRFSAVLLVVLMVVMMMPSIDVQAKSKPKFVTKTKTLTVGQTTTIRLKNANHIKWKSTNNKVLGITMKMGNKIKVEAIKPGKSTIVATYKHKKYKITLKVKQKKKAKVKDNPVLNATDVKLYNMNDTAKRFVKDDKSHLREFRFKVAGTDKEVKSWELIGEDKDFFDITSYGLVTVFWGPSYDDWEASAMVKATLEDGRKLTAKVTVYSELNIYINEVFKEFTTQYITADMNDLEKAEKAAWYIGATTEYKYYTESWTTLLLDGYGDCMASRVLLYEMCRYMGVKVLPCCSIDYHGNTLVKYNDEYYLFTTGYNEPKPRHYDVRKVEGDTLKQIMKDNHLYDSMF